MGRTGCLFINALCLIALVSLSPLQATVIHVPGDHPTIQQGIDATVNGDVVLVANGTFTGPLNRNLKLYAKRITVMSENGPDKCFIDCKLQGRAFVFNSGETRDSRIMGFTLLRGRKGNGINTEGQGV